MDIEYLNKTPSNSYYKPPIDGNQMILPLADMSWEDFDYPADLKRRDVMDLPGYHHRDDCIVLWDAILEYVQGRDI